MKNIVFVILTMILVVGCSPKPEIIDNGQPGEIWVKVFMDENRNGKLDQNEPGIIERVGISQDISCPAGNINEVTIVDTDTNGEFLFAELEPGVYCVALMSNRVVSTKLANQVPLSSEEVIRVHFGITEE